MVLYTLEENNLSIAVSEFTGYMSINMIISDVRSGSGDQEGVCKADGTINIG